MLRSMFGIGGSEILVILIVALLFLGPDKLPDAAKTISKGIRDLKKQSRALQNQIESDETIGGAIRDLKSALRGDELPVRPPVRREPPKLADATAAAAGATAALTTGEPATETAAEGAHAAPEGEAPPTITLPMTAGEADPDMPEDAAAHDELGHLIKPAPGTVPKGAPVTADAAPASGDNEPKQKHG